MAAVIHQQQRGVRSAGRIGHAKVRQVVAETAGQWARQQRTGLLAVIR